MLCSPFIDILRAIGKHNLYKQCRLFCKNRIYSRNEVIAVWGIQGRQIQERFDQIRHVSNDQVSFSTYYWGIDDCHLNNFRHRHSFFELCYVVQGQGSYHEESAEILLSAGTMFLSKPGVIHQIRSDSGLEIVFVAFDLDTSRSLPSWSAQFDELAATPGILHDYTAESELLPDIWRMLCRALHQNSQQDTALGLALALLTSIPTALGATQTSRPKPTVSNPLVERATKFIHDNAKNTLPLGAVASYLQVSERHLSKVLKRSTGMSYSAWVAHHRILTARHLLTNTNLPIKAVAEESGFSSVHYFTNVFKQRCQSTPAHYRAHHSNYRMAGRTVETVFES